LFHTYHGDRVISPHNTLDATQRQLSFLLRTIFNKIGELKIEMRVRNRPEAKTYEITNLPIQYGSDLQKCLVSPRIFVDA
jgi:hypothetical protein